jgi:hypothetical protein
VRSKPAVSEDYVKAVSAKQFGLIRPLADKLFKTFGITGTFGTIETSKLA